jgi:flagellar protein FlaF
MNTVRYAEILEDDAGEARDRERLALTQSIELMETADATGASPIARVKAISFGAKLWTILIEDLADAGNGLPKDLKGNLISIGIWILRELESIRLKSDKTFADAIIVSKSIRDGLI